MVAIRGTGWLLAPCLVDLVHECDELAPNRSTISDGSIGDAAHSARTSDHNPDDGWVCAVDITDDKAGGCDADLLARHIVARRDPRVKYVIWNGTIAKSYASNGFGAWVPQPYTGLNAHEKHTHVSVHNTSAARNDLSPWWPQNEPAPAPPQQQEDDMATFDFVHVSNGKTYVIGPAGHIDDLTADEVKAVKAAGWQIKDLPLSVWNKGT